MNTHGGQKGELNCNWVDYFADGKMSDKLENGLDRQPDRFTFLVLGGQSVLTISEFPILFGGAQKRSSGEKEDTCVPLFDLANNSQCTVKKTDPGSQRR